MVTTAIVLAQQHPRHKFQPAGPLPASHQSSQFIGDLLWGFICLRSKCYFDTGLFLSAIFQYVNGAYKLYRLWWMRWRRWRMWIINLEDRSGLQHPRQPPALLPSHVFEESVHEYWNSPTNEARNILSLFAVEIFTCYCCCYVVVVRVVVTFVIVVAMLLLWSRQGDPRESCFYGLHKYFS